MSRTYLSGLRMGSEDARLATALYGYCGTLASNADKVVNLPYFDSPEDGVHISVLFLLGNTAATNVTLRVGSAFAYPVFGNAVCKAHEVLTFVFNKDINSQVENWRVVGQSYTASNDTPQSIGVASAGTSTDYARADHSHNVDPDLILPAIQDGLTDTIEGIVNPIMDNYISKDVIQAPYDMFYAVDEDTVGRLPINGTTTKMFLRSMAVSLTTEDDGETITTVNPTAPVWEAITSADVGLGNVTNHKQVTDVTYNASNGAVIVTKGDDVPHVLFNLGANAFLSTVYLPIEGGTMEGPLSFNTHAMTLTWENGNSTFERISVGNSSTPESPVFIFQQNAGEGVNNLLTIDNTGAITALKFVGALEGNADTATRLSHIALNSTSLNNTDGTFGFSGTGDPWVSQNWVGIQVGDANGKFQFAESNGTIYVRTYTNSWGNWGTLLTSANITSGDNNGQIKVGDTNVNVTGLGALAFLDTITGSELGDLSNTYVTVNTEQRVVGVKEFNNIQFLAPLAAAETHGILFKGTTQSAALYYIEPTLNGDGKLQLALSDSSTTPFEIGWTINNTTSMVHSFTGTEYVLTPLSQNSAITIRPGVNEWGTVGSANYYWGAMYALNYYGNLQGNANTATRALNDTNGLQIDTNYLKLSGGVLSGTVRTNHPFNQMLTGGTVTEASNLGASPNKYTPLRWSFNTSIEPSTGDIITIVTPSDGHDYGIFLSLDNGAHYYPITLTYRDRLIDQYPAGSFLTLIFDATNSAYSVYPAGGADNRTQVTGGTWRVLNYYDSGAPYGVRIYKQSTVNADLPLIISQLAYSAIGDENENSFTNNVYGYLNMDSTKVPTYNPYTGTLTAPSFSGTFHGSIERAGEFTTPTQVVLTGHVTGTSNESTKGWTVDTTIADNVILNSMLRGGITRNKLESGVVKVFTQTETSDITDFDSIAINGFFPMRSSTEMGVTSGYRPLSSASVYFNFVSPDNNAKMQLAGTGGNWLVRGNNGTLTGVEWRHLVVENLASAVNRPWNISIDGRAASATADANGNVFSDYYATKSELNTLLDMADALVFKGILDSSQVGEDPVNHRYSHLPFYGYSAGWTYKVDHDDIYAGQVCEVGDLVIAINNGPLAGQDIIAADWIVVQANLDGAITGTGLAVEPYSFAIYNSATGRVVKDTGAYMVSLNHFEQNTGTHETLGSLDGFSIMGKTYSDREDLISNVQNRLAFGDSGPQIRFQDNQLLYDGTGTISNGAIIYSGFSALSGIQSTFHFVTQGRTVGLRADGLLLHEKAVIGSNNANDDTLTIYGHSLLMGKLQVTDGTDTLTLKTENNIWQFTSTGTSNQMYSFSNSLIVNGNIVPAQSRMYSLGSTDAQNSSNNLHWARLYLGEFATYGSTTRPIYWNNGLPTPVEYTPYRIHYAYTDSGNTYYGFANHYIDADKLSVGTTAAPTQGFQFKVNGGAEITGTLQINSNILPIADNASSLGSADFHWQKLYIGDKTNNPDSTYGDDYTPICWRGGIPVPVTKMIQRKSFTFASGATQVQFIDQEAYTADTLVISIVITSGKKNLRSPISWSAGEHTLTLTTATTLGAVSGYVITARGIDLG